MANVLVEQSTMSEIADSIRIKNESSSTYLPSQMSSAITNLPVGAQIRIKEWDSNYFTFSNNISSGTINGQTIFFDNEDGSNIIAITVLKINLQMTGSWTQGATYTIATVKNTIDSELYDIFYDSQGRAFQSYTYNNCNILILKEWQQYNIKAQIHGNTSNISSQYMQGQIVLYS